MNLKTFVKISAVNNLSDARYCAGMYVDQLGFCLDDSNESFIEVEAFHQITEWVSGVELVGEFGNRDASFIAEKVNQYQLNAVQTDNAEHIDELQKLGLPIILRIDLSNYYSEDDVETIFRFTQNKVSYFLLEQDGEDLIFNSNWTDDYPIVLGFDVSTENLDSIIDSSAKGIALKGGEEIRPGLKDFDELADILEALEEE